MTAPASAAPLREGAPASAEPPLSAFAKLVGASVSPVDQLPVSPVAWVLLVGFVVAVLLVDLLVVHREATVIGFRDAAISSAVYVAIGLAFGLVVWAYLGSRASGVYYAGFLLEKSLSIDNVFVWAVIFGFFATPAQLQHRVLFWGVFGALVLRAAFIFAGAALLERFDWMVFVFGTLLVVTAVQLVRHRSEERMDPGRSRVIRAMRRLIPTTDGYHGTRFWVRESGILLATPLFLVLIAVEVTDVIFAVDSVPAILALTTNTFIVFSANAFALLGLRSLYFLLAGLARRFRYLDLGLGVLLAYIGAKLYYQGITDEKIPVTISLPVIVVVLATAIVASHVRSRRDGGMERDEAGEVTGARSG